MVQPASTPAAIPPAQSEVSTGTVGPDQSKRKKKPDWGEFYKNGLPKEVIVIDDTPPPEQTKGKARTTAAAASNGNMAQPAGKKRRTGIESAYDLGYYDRPSFSTIPQQYGEESSAASISTDRTTSLHTTAPTSLGSQGSAGASNGVYYEDANVGQKRKRVTTRKSARDEQKRRELETAGDAFLSYIPPPKPPIKAKEVPVPVVRDVSVDKGSMLDALSNALQYGNRHEKFDDDDGHYIVTPDTPLTDRCEFRASSFALHGDWC
jgi:dual-specificity kinase